MMDEDLFDWVAVRSDIFSKSKESNVNAGKFICGWNDESSKVAITLHEGARTASDHSSKNRACLLTLKELRSIHKQLCLINPKLDSAFPEQIKRKTSMPSKSKIENICFNIGHYLTEAVNLVGKHIVLSTVFDDEDSISEYEENLQEFKLKALETTVEKNYKELDEILKLRERAESLLEMKTIYILEDEICEKIFDSLSELYNFRLQPFVEIREIANHRVKEAKAKLSENVGPSIKEKAEKDFEKWTEESLIASEALQQMYLEYYRKTLSLVEGSKNRMSEEQSRFGKAAFELYAKPRLLKLNVQAFQEELKLKNALKAAKEFHRDKIKNQLAYLDCNDSSVYEIQRIADEVTIAQLDVLDAHLDLLTVEENLYKSQLQVLNKEYEDNVEMGVFVDAVEDPEEFPSIVNPVIEPNPKITKLKSKLGKIYRKRAAIRTKKNAMSAEMKKKKQMKEAVVEKNRKAATMVQKRKNMREIKELPSDKLAEERKKTLQRLKKYKKKAMILEAKDQELNEFEDESLLEVDSNSHPSLPNTVPRKKSFKLPPQSLPFINDSSKPSQSLPPPPPPPVSAIPPVSTIPPPPPVPQAIIPPPPPPPPPPSIPPPPPPPPPSSLPPPPLPSLSASMISFAKKPKEDLSIPTSSISEDAIKQRLSSLKKPVETKQVKAIQPFNLEEILNMRSKLKKPTINTEIDPKSEHPADITALLNSTMKRIRIMTEESDSDRSEHSDFD